MWLKKKSVLQGEGHYNSNIACDGTDWRTKSKDQSWPVSPFLPSAADAGKYFYLPTLGWYDSGLLRYVGGGGGSGAYWSSSAYSWDSRAAYYMGFYKSSIRVTYSSCTYGYRVGGFE